MHRDYRFMRLDDLSVYPCVETMFSVLQTFCLNAYSLSLSDYLAP